MSWATSSPSMAVSKEPPDASSCEGRDDEDQFPKTQSQRKKIVVVGLGMVGIAFM